jgi:tetratricopeptide (TPR) repeat protein
MSIVSALKSQEGSIRELAMLPQQQILKLAQMGQLNVSMVPIILSEKAQMVQQAANMQAMAQGTPASVTETDMATIAQAEAQQAPMGIEALPSGQQMYDEQSLAGGGIVAFEDGGAVPRFQVGGTFDMFMPDDADRTPFGEVAVPVELTGKLGLAQIYDIKSGKYGRTRDEILKAFNVAAPAPARAQAAPAAPAAPVAPAAPEVTPVGIAANAPRAAAPAVAPAAPKQTAPTIEELIKEQQQYGPKGQAFEDLEKEIRGSAEQKKADRQQNMWMRVAEAGFGIMSGQSPYALTNIGKGVSAAMQSYAEDLKEQKKLDREDRKTLADIQQARRAEAKGDYDKAANLREKALNRMSEDDRARLQRETQERVARIGVANRPSPFQEYLQNPEKYAEFSKAVRPGFENAETQRDRLALDMISNELMTMKKDDPRRKQLEQTRQSILQKILTPSFGGSLEAPADINALVKKYTTK